MKLTPPTVKPAGGARPGYSGKPRRYPRFGVDARISVFCAGQRRPHQGRTLGISEAGISAVLAADLEVGENVSLEFTLPSSTPSLAVRAVIRNRTGARYGFEFLTLSEQQRTLITKFCEAQDE
jgi:c-di-GMP-binding flagellar brake protein YcgR